MGKAIAADTGVSAVEPPIDRSGIIIERGKRSVIGLIQHNDGIGRFSRWKFGSKRPEDEPGPAGTERPEDEWQWQDESHNGVDKGEFHGEINVLPVAL